MFNPLVEFASRLVDSLVEFASRLVNSSVEFVGGLFDALTEIVRVLIDASAKVADGLFDVGELLGVALEVQIGVIEFRDTSFALVLDSPGKVGDRLLEIDDLGVGRFEALSGRSMVVGVRCPIGVHELCEVGDPSNGLFELSNLCLSTGEVVRQPLLVRCPCVAFCIGLK